MIGYKISPQLISDRQPFRSTLALITLLRKLHMSYSTLSINEITIWRLLRHLVSSKRQWLFEGHTGIPGQLWCAERELLYDTVRNYRPLTVFEVGTWRGGGSTLFIAQALYANGMGELYTTDIDHQMVDDAERAYIKFLPHLLPFIRFHRGSSTEEYPLLLENRRKVDLLFLDGQEDREQTFSEFSLFEPFLTDGSLLLTHDWYSEKMAKLRPYLEMSKHWEVVQVISPPKSMGFAVVRHL